MSSSGRRKKWICRGITLHWRITNQVPLFAFGAEIALPNQKAYTDCQLITEDKVRDLKSLLPDIPEDKSELFCTLTSSWPKSKVGGKWRKHRREEVKK
ncbi:hypothetical protein ANN_09956 [Periplaneta americana]|uniref:Uncharacterized protein n=1 Tax=Periplaneta americana TaxID=6978 RepID=A0ABQ8TPU0_PERAM|nr:hypothetical protein ANN_09956 [Periplaneta americana]